MNKVYEPNKMPSKRTGIMPSKKNFTAVGGVGARPFSMQNKISRQAPRVSGTMNMVAAAPPPPPPAPALDNLFNIYSFGNTFDGKKFTGYPDKKLENNHWRALIAATIRWKNFLSYHPDGLNAIRTKYKQEFGKEWKGLELVGINYSRTVGIAGTSAVKLKGTKLPYGFVLDINKNMLTNGLTDSTGTYQFSQINIEHVFAHELGHVLNLCNTLTPDNIVRIPGFVSNVDYIRSHQIVYKRIEGNLPDATAGRAISSIRPGSKMEYTKTYLEHAKLLQAATTRAAIISTYIMLSDDGKHWNDKMVSLDVHEWRLPDQIYKPIGTQKFSNFYNELMQPYFHPSYDNENGYLISNKSLKYLIETPVDGYQLYVEKTPGTSEVSGVVKFGPLSDLTHILKGAAGRIFPAFKGVTTVERTDANDANDAYNVVYPEGHVGDCDDEEETIQIVKNHERIVNDPTYMANRIRCCS